MLNEVGYIGYPDENTTHIYRGERPRAPAASPPPLDRTCNVGLGQAPLGYISFVKPSPPHVDRLVWQLAASQLEPQPRALLPRRCTHCSSPLSSSCIHSLQPRYTRFLARPNFLSATV